MSLPVFQVPIRRRWSTRSLAWHVHPDDLRVHRVRRWHIDLDQRRAVPPLPPRKRRFQRQESRSRHPSATFTTQIAASTRFGVEPRTADEQRTSAVDARRDHRLTARDWQHRKTSGVIHCGRLPDNYWPAVSAKFDKVENRVQITKLIWTRLLLNCRQLDERHSKRMQN